MIIVDNNVVAHNIISMITKFLNDYGFFQQNLFFFFGDNQFTIKLSKIFVFTTGPNTQNLNIIILERMWSIVKSH
jgi:vesicle coat complex subunit